MVTRADNVTAAGALGEAHGEAREAGSWAHLLILPSFSDCIILTGFHNLTTI